MDQATVSEDTNLSLSLLEKKAELVELKKVLEETRAADVDFARDTRAREADLLKQDRKLQANFMNYKKFIAENDKVILHCEGRLKDDLEHIESLNIEIDELEQEKIKLSLDLERYNQISDQCSLFEGVLNQVASDYGDVFGASNSKAVVGKTQLLNATLAYVRHAHKSAVNAEYGASQKAKVLQSKLEEKMSSVVAHTSLRKEEKTTLGREESKARGPSFSNIRRSSWSAIDICRLLIAASAIYSMISSFMNRLFQKHSVVLNHSFQVSSKLSSSAHVDWKLLSSDLSVGGLLLSLLSKEKELSSHPSNTLTEERIDFCLSTLVCIIEVIRTYMADFLQVCDSLTTSVTGSNQISRKCESTVESSGDNLANDGVEVRAEILLRHGRRVPH